MSNDVHEKSESVRTEPLMITAGAVSPQEGAGSPAPAQPQTPENEELRWMQEHEKTPCRAAGSDSASAGAAPPKKPRRKRVQRKTCLRGQSIDPPRYSKQTIRRQTEKDLEENDPDIPYIAWEKATKDLICSLIERQDRLTRNFLLRVGDLEYRIEDLEGDMDEHPDKAENEEGKVKG